MHLALYKLSTGRQEQGRFGDASTGQARRSVSRGAWARTRLAKGMMARLPHEAYAPTQPFLHALHGADAPSDARTTVAAIATPSPGAGCRGQRQPVLGHLADEALTAAH